jgi:hypothetical protein
VQQALRSAPHLEAGRSAPCVAEVLCLQVEEQVARAADPCAQVAAAARPTGQRAAALPDEAALAVAGVAALRGATAEEVAAAAPQDEVPAVGVAVQLDAAAAAVPSDAEEVVGAAQLDAAAAGAAARRDAAAEEAVAAPGAAEVLVAQAVLAVLEEERPSGLPSVWVFRQDPTLPWPAPPRSAPIGRAQACGRIAWPSERWWQAALVSVLSCALDPGGILKGEGRERGNAG